MRPRRRSISAHPIDEVEPAGAEVYLRGTDTRLAYVHGDQWHGRIELEVGAEVEVDVRFLDADQNVIAYGTEYSLRSTIADGQPTDLIAIAEHGDADGAALLARRPCGLEHAGAARRGSRALTG